MKKIKFLLLFLLPAFLSTAQNDIPYTHFVFNKMAYNPGYTGNKKALDFTAIYRNQWSAINGSPESGTFSVQLPFAQKRNAFGLAITSDQIGKVKNVDLDLSYAYHIPFNKNNTLSIGLMGRIEQTKIDWAQADPLELEDGQIPSGNETSFTPNFGFGAYYSGKNYYVGLSIPRLMKNALYLDGSDNIISARDISTWYLMGGYLLSLTDQIELAPSFLISMNPSAPVDLDINANVIFLKSLWVGLNYRWGDSINGLVGYEFKNGMRMGIGLDYTLSELDKATTGSFEVMLGYTFQCQDCSVTHLRFF